ncbi:MAG: hypothetical protein RI949_2838 [Pseudomonadota bacterium]|jgi:hypothetical protein
MPHTPVGTRVQRHRAALRLAGLRPVQIWVPDTRRPDFAQECAKQSARVAASETANPQESAELQALMDQACADVEGWIA